MKFNFSIKDLHKQIQAYIPWVPCRGRCQMVGRLLGRVVGKHLTWCTRGVAIWLLASMGKLLCCCLDS